MKYALVAVGIVICVLIGYRLTQAESPSRQYVQRMEEKLKPDLKKYQTGESEVYSVERGAMTKMKHVYKPEEDWRKVLNDQEFEIAFRQGTERAFSGSLNANKRHGVYRSKVSGNDLFHSDHKFDSGTGWPSFYKPVHEANIELHEDNSLFMKRIEVVDRVSGAHLGHVFEDGPAPTGLRYCINSDALEFVEGVAYQEPAE